MFLFLLCACHRNGWCGKCGVQKEGMWSNPICVSHQKTSHRKPFPVSYWISSHTTISQLCQLSSVLPKNRTKWRHLNYSRTQQGGVTFPCSRFYVLCAPPFFFFFQILGFGFVWWSTSIKHSSQYAPCRYAMFGELYIYILKKRHLLLLVARNSCPSLAFSSLFPCSAFALYQASHVAPDVTFFTWRGTNKQSRLKLKQTRPHRRARGRPPRTHGQ